MNNMEYNGYSARIEYSSEDNCFFGRIAGIKDIITFEGESVKELTKAFHEAVDFYLQTCIERCENPDKPYSGKIMISIDPALHAKLASKAESMGKSLNQYAAEVLAQI